jgi:hypothetical protein
MMARRGYPEAAARIQELFLAGRREEAIAAVPDEYVDQGALIGPASASASASALAAARRLRPHAAHRAGRGARAISEARGLPAGASVTTEMQRETTDGRRERLPSAAQLRAQRRQLQPQAADPTTGFRSAETPDPARDEFLQPRSTQCCSISAEFHSSPSTPPRSSVPRWARRRAA